MKMIASYNNHHNLRFVVACCWSGFSSYNSDSDVEAFGGSLIFRKLNIMKPSGDPNGRPLPGWLRHVTRSRNQPNNARAAEPPPRRHADEGEQRRLLMQIIDAALAIVNDDVEDTETTNNNGDSDGQRQGGSSSSLSSSRRRTRPPDDGSGGPPPHGQDHPSS